MNRFLTFIFLYGAGLPHLVEGAVYFLKASLVVSLAAGLAFTLDRCSARSRCWVWRGALASLAALAFWKFGPHAITQHHPDWSVIPDSKSLNSVTSSLRENQAKLTTHPFALGYMFFLGIFALLDRAIPVFWITGLFGSLLWRLGRAILGNWWLSKSSLPAGEIPLESGARIASLLDVPLDPRIYLCPDLTTPLVTGIFHPVIYLPATSSNWKPDRLHAVLLHEMAHWERADLFWQMFAAVITSVWWWNPFVWIAARKLREEAEQAADDVVLLNRHPAADYAETLVDIASIASPRRLGTGIAMVGRSSLETRIAQLLVANPVRGQLNRIGLFSMLALVWATLVLGGIYFSFGFSSAALANDKVAIAFHDAEKLTREGRYEAALQKFLYYWEASKTDVGQGGVRLSFALAAWLELGAKYPKALAALVAIRDQDEKEISAGNAPFQSFQEYASLNQYLHQPSRTYATFENIYAKNPQVALRYYFVMEDTLVAHHRYQICSSQIPDANRAYENLRRGREIEIRVSQQFSQSQEAFILNSADKEFEKAIRQLIEILVGSGRLSEAQSVQKQALATLSTQPIQSAVSDAQKETSIAPH